MRHPLLLLFLTIPPSLLAWEPTWESLDSRPLPPWFDEAKFGIFIHWGVFSVPSFGNEWFWWEWQGIHKPNFEAFVNATEAPGFTYQQYAPHFDASLYDPEKWVKLFADSGAQYVVLTSKHHEGYCNWDSRSVPATWNWNAMDVGPHRDILGDLAAAVKKQVSPITNKRLRWGSYHSLFEWFNPEYLADKASGFKTTAFRDNKVHPSLHDLVKKYEPELIWSDGDWEADDTYWNSQEFLAWYATNSSVAETAIWNDRWGHNCRLKHGAYFSGPDRFKPGKLLAKKWEMALTIDANSWGYSRISDYTSYLSSEYFVKELAETVAFGGNMLLNVGPSHDGTIDPIFFDRLLGIGSWLKVNGEGIYSTVPWKVQQNETAVKVYYTTNLATETLYAIATEWPKDNELILEYPQTTDSTRVRMVGLAGGDNLAWATRLGGGAGLVIKVPPLTPDKVPCQYAWVFAMTGIANLKAVETESVSRL